MASDLISRLKKILSDDIENKHRKEYNRVSSHNRMGVERDLLVDGVKNGRRYYVSNKRRG